MYGVLPLLFYLMEISTMLLLLTLLVDLLGCFQSNANMMFSYWGGEIALLTPTFTNLALFIVFHVLRPINNKVVSKENIDISLIQSLLSLLKAMFPKPFGMRLIKLCYLINRLPTPVLQNKSPFQKLFHHSPDYNFLRIFGCACFPNLRPYNQHKFDFRSKECVFLGYSRNHKGYKCFHPPTNVHLSGCCFP
jgi:hypothetical protein